MKRLFSWIEKNEFLLVVICVLGIMRIPSIFEPNWYGDEGIYLVLGKALKNGLIWYKQIHDNKPPLLYFLAALAGSVFWFRTLLLGWMVMTTIVFERLSRKLVDGWMAKAAVIIFVIFTNIPLLEGNVANAEIFMVLPTILGLWLLINDQSYFWAGICFGAAFLFKVPAIFEFVGVMFFFFSVFSFWKEKKFWLLITGLLLPIGLTLIYYGAVGALKEYVSAAFFQNIGYLSSWGATPVASGGTLMEFGLTTRALILFFLVAAFWWIGRKAVWKFRLVWVWFMFSLFGALLSGRPYPHYLIQTVASGSLLLVNIFSKKTGIVVATLVATVVLTASVVKYKFNFYPVLPYYGNFVDYLFGNRTKEQHDSFFDWRVGRTELAAAYIRKNITQDDRIFIWGDEPFIYLLTKRLPVGKFTVAYHILDFNAKMEVAELVLKTQPKIIVVSSNEARPYWELDGLLATNYVLVKEINGLLIYLKLNTN